ncbi:MAG TPA: hypothetical protein VK181_07415 [Rhizobium sp.]|nr:hypothetical protein [Rhizobium sp.]
MFKQQLAETVRDTCDTGRSRVKKMAVTPELSDQVQAYRQIDPIDTRSEKPVSAPQKAGYIKKNL